MDPLILALIFAGGTVAGVMNTVAGGGSLITLPLLIFAGLPAGVANGSNRLAVLLQNVAAVATFHGKGVRLGNAAWWLQIPLLAGSVVGVLLAVRLDEAALKRVIGIVLVVMLVPILHRGKRAKRDGIPELHLKNWMWPAYFALGIYGGFIQAGIGFFFLALLVGGAGLDLVRANAIKVFLVLGYTVLATVLFMMHGQFSLLPAAALAAGNALGGFLGAHLAVEKGERWIRWVLAISVIASAVQLTGLGSWILGLLGGQ